MKKQIFKKAVGGWWPCEEKVLISMLEDKYPVHFIAEVLGRDRMGVHTKISVMQRNENKKMEQAA
mgnify:FL=1